MNIDIITALIETGLASDAEHAKTLINCGLVFMGDRSIDAGSKITEQELEKYGLRVKYSKPYVSRGAEKLLSVFKNFELNVKDFKCIDAGSSTGGFTQLLLKKGASFVYAVDVGRVIIDSKLKNDPRVFVMEGINARLLSEYEIVRKNITINTLDLAVFDLSFISLKMVVPSVLPYIKNNGWLIALVKPQFEVERKHVQKGGVVRDEKVITELLANMKDFFKQNSLDVIKVIPSALKGPSGNQEYFYVMQKK